MTAPERIWAVHHETHGSVMIGEWADTIRHIGGTEYIRADLVDPLSDPRVKVLVELLHEAKGDLAAYVEADWPAGMRAQYPSYQRKWERDMELCNRIDAALINKKGGDA